MRRFFTSLIFLTLVELFTVTFGYAQQTNRKQLYLIPQPQILVRGDATFALTPEKLVYIVNPDDTALLFDVNEFFREVKQDLGFDMNYGQTVKKASLLVGYPGQDKKFDKIAEPYIRKLDQCGKEGYVLHIDQERLILVANNDTGLFYGVQTLRQLVRGNRSGDRIPALDITDWPALKYRGWQDDISRGPIPTMEFLKAEIRRMSYFKMNIFTLYTENVFKLKSHPRIAPPDGITAAQVKELSAYARKYHIDLVGNFQAFGHFGKILQKPYYAHLAETPSVISPAFPETYDLLGDILREIASAYDSRFFMINCDEVFGLGSGPAKTMVDTMGIAGVYAYHINKLVQILKPFHKTILMWGDIAGDYPEIISKLPDDIVFLPWVYQSAPSYKFMIEPFKKAGMNFWVCPGISCWRRIFPGLSTAEVNISHFVRDGVTMGAEGMLNTTWDDDGENFFSYNWLPLAWGAACAWKPVLGENDSLMNRRYKSFTMAFDPVYYGANAGIAINMLGLDGLKKHISAGNLADRDFWSPMIESIPEFHIVDFLSDAMSLEKESSAVIRAFLNAREIIPRNRNDLDYLIFAARRVQLMARKNKLKYRLNDPQEMKHIRKTELQRSLKGLENQLAVMKKDYARLWNMENRPWWLDHILAKFDRMERDLKEVPCHVFIETDTAFFAPERTVTLRSLFADNIYYTLDGTPPDTSSTLYKEPFKVDHTTRIRATVYDGKCGNPVFERIVRVYHGPVAEIKLKYPFSEEYSARGLISLVDSIKGSKNFHDGNWLGFEGRDLIADIRFKKPVNLDTVTVTFLQNMQSEILFPEWVSCVVSENGMVFSAEKKIVNSIDWHRAGAWIQPFSFAINRENIRFIRIHAKNVGILPPWHNKAGGKAWIFTDEIGIGINGKKLK